MKRAILAWAAVSVGLGVGPARVALAQGAAKQAEAPIDLKAPLPTDPRLVKGTLDNGLSYIVVNHAGSPGRAYMWIHVSSGSLNETDAQRGLAHYLEHMAFNGSENFPPGSVVDFFQSMGLRFGQDQNAFTSFDQTTYQLSFPDVKPETIETGMRFFSDVSRKLLLKPEEIDRERQVIIEEKRTRAGGRQRIQDYVLERIAPGSLVGQRLPIGVDSTLMSVQRPDFVAYYDKWYVPSNMTVMVVADGDPEMIAGKIRQLFSGGEKTPRPVDVDPRVSPSEGVRAIVASDKELTQTSIDIMRIRAKEEPTTTVGDLRRDLVRGMGTGAFNRRIGERLTKGGTAYLRASANASDMFNVAFMTGVDVDGEPGKWQAMLNEVATEVQRARLHGFTQREMDDLRKDMLADAEREVQQESTMAGRVLVQQINSSVADGDTKMSAAQELALLKQLLPTITAQEVSAEFARLFEPSAMVVVAEFPADMAGGVPSESDVTTAATKAFDVKPDATAEEARPDTLMAKAPTPGKIAEQSEHAASAVTSGWLENGVRFHYRFMDYKKDQVTVAITLAAGAIEEDAKTRGKAELAGVAWGTPATSTLSSTNIRDLFTGKNAQARGGAGLDALSLMVGGTTQDIETGMQLAHLMLTDPVLEASAFERWKTNQLRGIEARKKTVEGVFAETVAETIYPEGETRTALLTAAQINALSPDASQKWLRQKIATAPMEVTIVGDIPKAEAMRLLTTYIGSLPKRERISDKTMDDLRALKRPSGPRAIEKTVDTQTDKAMAAIGFYACDSDNVEDRRNLQVASRIISTRMMKIIREEEQLAYSPRAGLRPGTEFPGFGTFALITQTNPAKAARLIEVTNKVYEDFAKDGPTADEMDTVRKQLANELDEQMREPSFWMSSTAMMDYRGTKLDDVMTAAEYYQKVTPEAIKATFDKYDTPDARLSVIAKPAKAPEPKAEAAPKG